jgi:hypothetical protein
MNSDLLLSPHFRLVEFTASAAASKHGIDNTPSDEAVENLRALCLHTLEPLRNALGQPIVITSGYRCRDLNVLLVNHAQKSQHINGQAADFYVDWKGPDDERPSHRERLIKAFRQIILDEHIHFDQCIIYPSFIHVSYVRSGIPNRRRMTRGFSNGTYTALSLAQALALE